MADKTLDSLVGGGIHAEHSAGNTASIPIGTVAGDVLTVTPPAGKFVKLTFLATNGTTLLNASVKFGDRIIYNGPLGPNGAVARFTVGTSISSASDLSSALTQSVTGRIDESFTLTYLETSAKAVNVGWSIMEIA